MSARGLRWRKWGEPVEDFVRRHGTEGPRWAVLLTYDCAATAVAREVLPLLHKRGRAFKTLILADAGRMQQQLVDDGFTPLECNIYNVRIPDGGVFHPKLLFLRAGRRCLIGFGSANLTNGGLGQNFELWGTTEDEEIVSAATAFLRQICADRRLLMSASVSHMVAEATAGFEASLSPRFWSSLMGTFHEYSDRHRARSSGTRLTIISPAYASEKGMRDALRPWSGMPIQVKTDNSQRISGASFHVFDPYADRRDASATEDDSDQAGATRLHAKAYLFEERSRASLWLGSANLTMNALRRPVSGGGNIEILVQTDLPPQEARRMHEDLDTWFKDRKLQKVETIDEDDMPRPIGKIVAAELEQKQRRLHIEADLRHGEVFVSQQPNAAAIEIRIKNGVGSVRLPSNWQVPATDAPSCWLVFERVDRKFVAVLVNLPFMSAHSTRSGDGQLDDVLDELWGNYHPRGEDCAEDENESVAQQELDNRLDEVRHQGELDRLAVKVALIKKRLRSEAHAEYREHLREHVMKQLLPRLQPHVRDVVSRWLGEP